MKTSAVDRTGQCNVIGAESQCWASGVTYGIYSRWEMETENVHCLAKTCSVKATTSNAGVVPGIMGNANVRSQITFIHIASFQP